MRHKDEYTAVRERLPDPRGSKPPFFIGSCLQPAGSSHLIYYSKFPGRVNYGVLFFPHGL